MISSTEIKKARRQKRSIRIKNPENTNQLLTFEVSKHTGNCCWKLSDRNRGGQQYDIAIPGTYEPGWPIQSVKLLKRCTMN